MQQCANTGSFSTNPRRPVKFGLMVHALIALMMLGYFSYHLLSGNRGLQAMSALQIELKHAHAHLSDLQQQQSVMMHRTSLLRPDSLDLDMLDEQARRMLGYMQPNELVLLDTPSSQRAVASAVPHNLDSQ